MRSSKYHDYRVLKIALFIILVVLGLFIYIKCIRAPLEHTAPDNAWKVLTEATCTTDGQRCKVCTECGEEFDHESIPATGHNISDWITKKEATCTEAGLRTKECKNCKKALEQEGIPASGHIASEWIVETQATCTTSGSKYQSCKSCDKVIDRQTIDATGHVAAANPTSKINYVAPTCTEGGSQVDIYLCTKCWGEAKRETVQIDPTGHTAGEQKKENVNDSTHTEVGFYNLVTYCGTCDAKMTSEVKAIDPKGHDYSNWEVRTNETTGEYELVGTCDCDESGNVIVLTTADGLTVTLDESVPLCVAKQYNVTVTYDGTVITEVVVLDREPHAIYTVEKDGVITYVTMDDCVKISDIHGRYFDIGLPGMHLVVDEDKGETVENVWSDDGFATAAFKCARCGNWVAVLVYSPEYDATLPPKNDEE